MSIQAFVNFKSGILATTPEEQKKFISGMKEWMKAENISIKWLSDNLGKSQGTVKNWLYAGTNIIPENQQAIIDLYGKIQSGLLKANSSATPQNNIMFYGYVNDIESLTYWGSASNALTDVLFNEGVLQSDDEDVAKLARWFTNNIMENAKTKILEKRREIAKKTASFSIRALPRAISSLDLENTDKKPRIIVDKTLFNELYVLIAAKICGYENANDWINDLMDSTSDNLIERDLEEWESIPF